MTDVGANSNLLLLPFAHLCSAHSNTPQGLVIIAPDGIDLPHLYEPSFPSVSVLLTQRLGV